MATKLTLSADPEVVKAAKELAARRGTSVSELFATFVRAASAKRAPRKRMGRLARKVSGIIRVPKEKSYRELLEDALSEKYGF
ncbi:MAG TPA: DUF6364 family protein [Phycisphaerae bacterium]|nr:DUF6364 family protein [Phycisphaerae bacterium]